METSTLHKTMLFASVAVPVLSLVLFALFDRQIVPQETLVDVASVVSHEVVERIKLAYVALQPSLSRLWVVYLNAAWSIGYQINQEFGRVAANLSVWMFHCMVLCSVWRLLVAMILFPGYLAHHMF